MIPQIGTKLTNEHIAFLKAFSKSCRNSIIKMISNAQSGHPGGSLSSIDFISLIYTFIISQTGEQVVISNGHISPAIYSVLAELQYIPKIDVVNTFRKIDSIYEGHPTRLVDGIEYGTGPLGIGVSVAAGFAYTQKQNSKKVFAVLGDGECDEGQVYEMMNFAHKYNLNNLVLILDSNQVQLSDSTNLILPINIPKYFEAGGWNVLYANGHEFDDLWNTLSKAYLSKDAPTIIIADTIMGKGVSYMESEGILHKSTWHGNSPSPELAQKALDELKLSQEEEKLIEEFIPNIKWRPSKAKLNPPLLKNSINIGNPILYTNLAITDCRTAYGMALLDLAQNNTSIFALSADLKGSTMTKFVAEKLPGQHIECGIAEQNMLSVAGGLSLNGIIPFASTFGAFMTSRAKDQARVNDINLTNVKMVATHCGLSVGEDGPTHQSIDDNGSMLGLFNTMVIEPCDPNQTDRVIRYIASHNGNFYIRMGRHKFPAITKPNGSEFFDVDYQYKYGQTDLIRSGTDITIVATGATVIEAQMASDELRKQNIEVEVIAVSSLKCFDDNLFSSIEKTGKLITVEDHNPFSGIGGQISRELILKHIYPQDIRNLGVTSYQLSGKASELYARSGIDSKSIIKNIQDLIN